MQNHLRKSKQQCLFTHSNTYATKENPIEKEEQTTTTTTNNINRYSSTNTGKTKPNILKAEQRHRSAPKTNIIWKLLLWKIEEKAKRKNKTRINKQKRFLLEKKISILLALNEEGWTKRAKQQPEEQKNASATYSVKNCNQEYFLIYGVHKNTHSRFFMYYNNNKVWKKTNS